MNTVRILVAAILSATGVAKAGDPPPIKLYAQPAAALAARLSPDGKRVALIATYQGRQVLYVHSLEEGGKDGKIVRTADFEIRWVRWKDNDHLITGVVRATDRLFGDTRLGHYAVTRLAAVDASGDHVTMIGEPPGGFPLKGGAVTGSLGERPMIHPQLQDDVLSMLPQTPGRILQEAIDKVPILGTKVGPAVYSVDIATGRHQLVDPGDERMAEFLVDQKATIRIGIELDGLEQVVYSRLTPDDPWRAIHRSGPNKGEVFDPLAFVPDDPHLLYVLSNVGPEGKEGLWSFDTTTGQFVSLIDGEARLGSAVVRDGLLLSYERKDDKTIFLDPAWQADYDLVKKAMKGGPVKLLDRAADGSRALLEVNAAHKPKVWWVLDRTVKPLSLWPAVEQYPDLPAEQVAPVKEVTYTARDGLKIPAYLTLPVGYKDGPIAFVVLPHGGPYVCEGSEFDYESQFLASRGWGVLRPEYRGTTCYGPDYERRGFREWGFAMQDDVTDGTRWLIEQKYADPSRICIVGGSYGGYAALEGAAKEPDLYRCAAAWAPVTDLFELRKAIKGGLYNAVSLDRLGDDDDRLDAASPALHADRIKIPVLLMHGKEDFTVVVNQSRYMESALRSANKPVEAIYLDHADHYRQDFDARLAWLSALDRFLGAQLGKR
jgi:dipeptidyl aminopeptidase/acylaminoacyl peptidase